MKRHVHPFYLLTLGFGILVGLSAFMPPLEKRRPTSEGIYAFPADAERVFSMDANWHYRPELRLPYKKAGLTAEQAAAHLLSRFTYGAQPGEVERVVRMGLEKWLMQQLDGNLNDTELDTVLRAFPDIHLSNAEVEDKYPRNAQIIRFAVRDGYVSKDSVNNTKSKANRERIQAYMAEKGYKPQQELFRALINQKITRAIYTRNQLHELLTDFWFNHFNVSLSKNQCAAFVPAFERDVIRPRVSGSFEDLLVATAKSPAMLMYLDNFSSSGTNIAMPETGMAPSEKKRAAPGRFAKIATLRQKVAKRKAIPGQNAVSGKKAAPGQKALLAKKKSGLNENYAREVMELHTLGVDGGYTQNDVTQAARILTGWTLAPISDIGYGSAMKKLIQNLSPEQLQKRGFVIDGDFMFAMNRHDNGEKVVLGKTFPAGGGYQEGLDLLKMLAHHPATAKFISRKLATRFVSDQPAPALVDAMAKTFLSTNGDIKSVLITMVNAPEFWSPEALREKTKSPFELAISAVRGLDAAVKQPYQLYSWINKMGQQMYYYQAPTGFPDRGQYWINTGSLLSRMNFGLALAAQRIPGIRFDLSALNDHHEPESAEAALLTYCRLLMPGRPLEATVERLKPMLHNPDLEARIAAAAKKNALMEKNGQQGQEGMMSGNRPPDPLPPKATPTQKVSTNPMLAQVVGVIIGSPEFQRK